MYKITAHIFTLIVCVMLNRKQYPI